MPSLRLSASIVDASASSRCAFFVARSKPQNTLPSIKIDPMIESPAGLSPVGSKSIDVWIDVVSEWWSATIRSRAQSKIEIEVSDPTYTCIKGVWT